MLTLSVPVGEERKKHSQNQQHRYSDIHLVRNSLVISKERGNFRTLP